MQSMRLMRSMRSLRVVLIAKMCEIKFSGFCNFRQNLLSSPFFSLWIPFLYLNIITNKHFQINIWLFDNKKTKRDLKNIWFEGFYCDAKLLTFSAFEILDKNGFLALVSLWILFLYLKIIKNKHIHCNIWFFDNRKKKRKEISNILGLKGFILTRNC